MASSHARPGVLEPGGVIKSYRDSTDSSELSLAQLEDVPLYTLSEDVEIQGTEWKYWQRKQRERECARKWGEG